MRELAAFGQLGERLVAALVALASSSSIGNTSSTSTSACVPDIWRKPSPWAKRSTSDSDRCSRSSVGSSMVSSGWWFASTPMLPTVVRVDSISTSSLKASPSGVRTSTVNGVRAMP